MHAPQVRHLLWLCIPGDVSRDGFAWFARRCGAPDHRNHTVVQVVYTPSFVLLFY